MMTISWPYYVRVYSPVYRIPQSILSGVQDAAEFECLTYIWLSDCEEKLIKVFIMFSCDVYGAILVL